MKPPPKHAPSRIASTADLRAFQRMMASAIIRPLTADDGLQPRWTDGRPMDEVAAEFIKPNDRLTSFERLQLYSRMYWFRLFDSIRDDCPGLLAALGERAFGRLAQAYLAQYPSRSFTLRNLCSRLERFILEKPRLTAPRTELASEIARFEWAQTVAFDGEARPVIAASHLARTPPSRLRLGLQPYITLLALRHPIDTYVIAVKRRDALRSEASNTPDAAAVVHRAFRRAALPRPRQTHVAVHRHNNRLFYKRLDPAAFRILDALRRGRTLSRAIAAAGPGVKPAQAKAWFTSWTALGWFCARGNKRRRAAS
ncbi:MAG TPA: putative DNA-binding domain-containing protein [Opitutaceae bacterium]|nr:putative DNA-binding domain-containing protein [Opitutaceae bacterium]